MGWRDEKIRGFDWGSHTRQLHKFVKRRFFGNSDEARDVVHDTYERLLRMPKELVIRNPEGWLCEIAKRIAIDIKRKEGVRKRAMPLLQTAPDDRHTESFYNAPDAEMSTDEIEEILAEVSKGLTPLQKAVLDILYDDEDLTLVQIATRLNVSIDRVRRAVARIREVSKDLKEDI